MREVATGGRRRFDKGGEQFYDQISALHKAVRGTDPDGALYWFARMLDGGCDPHYLARRIVRMAVEDIGLADPRGQQLALDAWQTFERLGSPEGELALANAVVYLAVAPKSNAVYVAYGEAKADVEQFGTLDVPLRFRNAPTKLMKGLGYGEGYQYAHDAPDAYVKGERYLPDEMPDRRYYRPAPRGLEIKIGEALARLRATSRAQRRFGGGQVMSWFWWDSAARWAASRVTAPIACGRRRRAAGRVPTFTVNLLGSFAIGLLYMYVAARGAQRRQCAAFLDDRRAGRVHHLLGVRAGNRAAGFFADRRGVRRRDRRGLPAGRHRRH